MKFKSLPCLLAVCCVVTAAKATPVPGAKSNQLLFIENKGQVTDQYLQPRTDVQYALRLKGVNAFVGNGQLHYQFSKQDMTTAGIAGFKKGLHSLPKPGGVVDMYRMDVELMGADVHAKAEALEQNAYYENYYLPQFGKDGAQAHSYSRIVYHDVYPHIDWILKIQDGQPEYEFVVNPGGNPQDIRIKYSGATALKINGNGSLTATTPMGTVTEHAPLSFQADGSKVASSFVLKDDVLSFNIAAYSGRLTIDPSLICATYYGGIGTDAFEAVTLNSNYLYLLGQAESAANIASIGAYQTTYGGGMWDAMIVKMDTAMTTRIWGTYYGGSGDEYAGALAADASGNIYIDGYTSSTSVMSSPGSFQVAYGGGTYDGFFAKFSSAGARVWGSYYGGSASDELYGIDVDANGKINMVGEMSSTGLSTAGAYQTILSGPSDVLLTQFDNSGARQWATYYGGTSDDGGYGLWHNSSNEIIVAGATTSTASIATAGTYQQTYGGGASDGMVVKFNSTGTTRSWGTYYGGSDDDVLYSAACDASNNIYTTGYTVSTNGIASPGAYQDTYGGGQYDAFLAKLNNSGVRQWATYMGGNDIDIAYATATDASNVYMFGYTYSGVGLATAGSYQEFNSNPGVFECFLEKFDFNGNISWGTFYGGFGNDYAGATSRAMCTGSTGNVYICGSSASTSGISTPGTYQPNNNANNQYSNGFVAKFNGCQSLANGGIGGNMYICRNSTNTYTTSVAGATTYYWTVPAGWTGSSNTSSITVTSNTTSGTIYVYASDGCGFSPVDSLQITVFDPHVTISASGPLTFCQGDYVALSDTNPLNWQFHDYQWQQNNVDIPNTNSYTYNATASGNYRVIMTENAQCNDTSNVISVTVNPTPTASITPVGPISICNGDSVVLSTPTGPGWTYQWKKNTLSIPGATNNSYAANSNGDFTVVATLGSCKDTSAQVTVTVQAAPPVPLVSINGPANVCAFTAYTYTTNNNGDADSYTWTLPSGWSGSSNWSNMNATSSANSGTITVTATNACGTTSPVSLNVTTTSVNPATTVNGNVISTTTTFDTYQWYYYTNVIPGATSQSYTMTQFGYYKVTVTKNGCSATTADVQWPAVGVSSVATEEQLSLYPNPNSGAFTLYGNLSTAEEKVDLYISDLAGRIVTSETVAVKDAKINKLVTLPADIPVGLYFIKVKTSKSSSVIPFTKQ